MTSEKVNPDDVAPDLVMALLAVNSWTLEKVASLYSGLAAEGLFDLTAVNRMEADQIQERLAAAGYRRGPVLGAMMALRIQNVALALADGGADLLLRFEATSNAEAARQYLLGLKGVGPTVAENYLLLRSSARS